MNEAAGRGEGVGSFAKLQTSDFKLQTSSLPEAGGPVLFVVDETSDVPGDFESESESHSIVPMGQI
jgi:hypothetical protein